MCLSRWLLAILISLHYVRSTQWSDNVADRCFCKLQGEVDDCSCKVESLDSLNNNKIYPRLQSLLSKNYFRYFKVNLQKPCPFWSDDSQCALKDCHVDICTQDELPEDVKETKHERENKYSKSAQIEHTCEEERELSALDTTLSDESKQAFADWKDYDDSLDMFCEVDDEDSAQMQHVDLLLNPERYTGYKGASPHRIWRSVYEENCFKPSETWTYGQEKESLSSMCLEKRAFYRMVSGLHTSINIHLSDRYLLRSDDAFGSQKWGPYVREFRRRFDPETTDGQGPQRLKNLYFTYLVELRALAKAAPYLLKERFYTGDGQADKEMRDAVQNLLQIIQDFPDHFDESKLFQGNSMESKKLKMEFRDHFRNISRIMDCVGCDKCRLWGKLQVLGMGTALKILFSGNAMGPDSTVNANFKADFQLTRTEIVALFNAFGRLSSSIHALENFRSMMR